MKMTTWAKNEVELAVKRELADPHSKKDRREDYGCMCYASALRAFRCLMKDGHSGASIAYTRDILMRLLTGRPLTAIEDAPEVWNNITDISGCEGEEVNYQCKRMSSLFKYVYKDGTVKYKDVDRCIGCNINNESATFTNGLISRIMDEMWPIKMPYYPGGQTKFYCEDFLTDLKNGDYDTVGVLRARRPDGTIVEINRYFKENTEQGGWIEIDHEEYEARWENHIMDPQALRAERAAAWIKRMEEADVPLSVELQNAATAAANLGYAIKEAEINDPRDGQTDAGTTGAPQSCGDSDACPLCNPDRYAEHRNVPGNDGADAQ